MSSDRLDALLVARGLAETLTLARALVLAGRVRCAGVVVDKAGMRIDADASLAITPGRRHVGRGALKLEGALADLALDPRARLCLDVGASTGGFTQVLVEAGATAVVALDVGRGLLDASLRSDPRVVVLEGINARALVREQLPFQPSLAVIDVSFISLTKVLPAVSVCLAPEGELVALVKPQFEVRRGEVGRGGIVRDPALHREVLHRIASIPLAGRAGLRALAPSRIRGAQGNVEFFVAFALTGGGLPPEELARRIDEIATPTREPEA